MKLKYLILLFVISVTSLLCMISYYHFDWTDLSSLSFYENIANPSIRIIKVQEGLRKEQIAQIMGDVLGWDEAEKDKFINIHLALNSPDLEGHYFPKTYMILKDEDPSGVTSMMFHEFSKETSAVNKPKTKQVINQETFVKIASIIQREAASKNDMRLISGIIWNRLFDGMRLQIDATLQYAKGTDENGWWTKVTPADKKIDSPYNTYKYNSLPPTAIANPGLAAIYAAYNPQKTSCLFYLHDKKQRIHCATTYSEHLKNIDKYY